MNGARATLIVANRRALGWLTDQHPKECEYVVVTTRVYRRQTAKHSSGVHEAAPEPPRNQEFRTEGSEP